MSTASVLPSGLIVVATGSFGSSSRKPEVGRGGRLAHGDHNRHGLCVHPTRDEPDDLGPNWSQAGTHAWHIENG